MWVNLKTELTWYSVPRSSLLLTMRLSPKIKMNVCEGASFILELRYDQSQGYCTTHPCRKNSLSCMTVILWLASFLALPAIGGNRQLSVRSIWRRTESWFVRKMSSIRRSWSPATWRCRKDMLRCEVANDARTHAKMKTLSGCWQSAMAQSNQFAIWATSYLKAELKYYFLI